MSGTAVGVCDARGTKACALRSTSSMLSTENARTVCYQCVLEGMVGSSYAVFQNNAAGAAGTNSAMSCARATQCRRVIQTMS
eukprot:3941722-Rhodomonas_salina.3